MSFTVDLGSIAGGKDASIDWIVRGDKEGDFFPTVHLSSTLLPIGAPDGTIDMDFKAAKPLHVFGASAVKMVF